jgi:two-component sensor histidine kinase
MGPSVGTGLLERPHGEERLLLREFSHRINNELASAISVISVAAARSANEEVKAALAAVQERLQNYAQVHHALQMPEHSTYIDAAAYLRQLCRAISRSKLDGRGITLLLVEHPFQMDSDRCWRLGLIVSELVTNAARHAFHSGGGVIRIELLPSKTCVECRISDNGSGEADISPGRGLEIVQALAKSLDGSIVHRFGPQGAASVLSFPVSSRSDCLNDAQAAHWPSLNARNSRAGAAAFQQGPNMNKREGSANGATVLKFCFAGNSP